MFPEAPAGRLSRIRPEPLSFPGSLDPIAGWGGGGWAHALVIGVEP